MSTLIGSKFLDEVKHKFKINRDKIVIENIVFRLFSKITVAILFLSCGLVTLQQLIGEHIRCITPPKEDVRPEALAQYCFIMSTYTLPHLLNKTVGVEVPHAGVGPYYKDEDDSNQPKYHAYYQWVPFALFFQGIFFLLPHYIWKSIEGGVLKAYCNLEIIDKITMKQRKLIDETGTDGEKNRESKVKTLSRAAEYFIAHMHHNHVYAFAYVFAEVLNFAVVVSNIFLTDAFLGYEFTTYGPNVVKFLSQEPSNRMDPMNLVFPKVTKCDFRKFGPSGSLINYDVMCVLALNVINEKIYTFLWFWFVIISIIGGLAMIYRLTVILFSSLRNRVISTKVLFEDEDALEDVTEKLSYCDWFVLKRLSDNINRIRFGELVQSIHACMPAGSRVSLPSFSGTGKGYDDTSLPPFSPGGKGYNDNEHPEFSKLIDSPNI